MSWRTLFLEINLPGELCSGIIICWRKSSGEMSPGEKFLGEICDEFAAKRQRAKKVKYVLGFHSEARR